MANTLLDSLVGLLESRTIGNLATSLGAPGEAVSQGLKSSIAAVLAGLVTKASGPGVLQRILDLVPGGAENMNFSQIVNAASDPNSPVIAGGKSILSALFDNSEHNVVAGVAGASGLRPGIASTILSMAAPMVASFLGKRIRQEGMTVDGLSARLQAESDAIRYALPANLRDLFWPAASRVETGSPVVTQEVRKERSLAWLPALAIALGLGALWLMLHARRPVERVTAPTGSANRVAASVCTLPTNLSLPANGVESRLLGFLQNFDAKLAPTTWFTFDRLVFETGSDQLRPESQAQLNDVAAILKDCRTIRLKIAGYTDNVGPADTNLRLSRNRANAVMFELIRRGVSPDSLTAEGYGQEFPIADNTTAEGRAKNRRVAMLVTQR
jgi:outer membrane protein OmpA-like peptidoglycan-associated protein